ncbi:MAG: metallophosphoesterase family protein, partial [Betaproteobacteria bacterium]
MRLALISDIHANRQALQACLAHARLQGVDQLAFLGDLVGYGGEPAAVLDQVMDLAAQGAWVLQGNHDEMALNPPAAPG